MVSQFRNLIYLCITYMLAMLSYTQMGSGIQAIDKANEILSFMTVCRNVFHNGSMAHTCYKWGHP